MAENLNDIYRGDTKNYTFNFGTGVDVTGWKIFLTFKESADDDDANAALQISTTAGDNVGDDVANGRIILTLDSTSSGTLEVGRKYFYGFQRVIPGSPPEVSTLLVGTLTILQDITQSVA